VNKPQDYPYATFLDVLHPALSVVDVPKLVEACTHPWYNQTLCKVNDSVVRLGVLQGEYHWHKHDNDDEFFFVLDGRFLIDLEDRTVELGQREGFVVPKGVVHRTRAPERAVILMVETATIVPTGDA
jgi:mannose-6-phosphate isomerase-like protein (cupin superfamily)